MDKNKANSRSAKSEHSVRPPSASYLKWIKKFPLRPIESEEHNEFALDVLSELMDIERREPDETSYMNVLSTLIGEFELATYGPAPRVKPHEMFEYLMEVHNMKQTDLVPDIFGTQAAVSYALSGKRTLTTQQISLLAKRFHVSPEVFFYDGPTTKTDKRIVAEWKETYTVKSKSSNVKPGTGKMKPGRQRK